MVVLSKCALIAPLTFSALARNQKELNLITNVEAKSPFSMPMTDPEAVHQKVREGYSQIAQPGNPCCGPTQCCGAPTIDVDKLVRQIGYTSEELAALPDGANLGLSCG